jgi:hypothetical protein
MSKREPTTTLPCGCVQTADRWVKLCAECEGLWQLLHDAAMADHADPEAAWERALAAARDSGAAEQGEAESDDAP